MCAYFYVFANEYVVESYFGIGPNPFICGRNVSSEFLYTENVQRANTKEKIQNIIMPIKYHKRVVFALLISLSVGVIADAVTTG